MCKVCLPFLCQYTFNAVQITLATWNTVVGDDFSSCSFALKAYWPIHADGGRICIEITLANTLSEQYTLPMHVNAVKIIMILSMKKYSVRV